MDSYSIESNCSSPISSDMASVEELDFSKITNIKEEENENEKQTNKWFKLFKSNVPTHRKSFSSSNTEQPQKNHEFRKRSFTWPLFSNMHDMKPTKEYENKMLVNLNKDLGLNSGKQLKNPWGNLSYSQLIERAIESSTWKSLSLKEIYAWFTKYIPYFKDKMHYKSTTGWKNSIRHNLSLHKRFIRIGIYHTNNYRRTSLKPVKFVWTSLKYKTKSLKQMEEKNNYFQQAKQHHALQAEISRNLFEKNDFSRFFTDNSYNLNANQLLQLNTMLNNQEQRETIFENQSSHDLLNTMKCTCSSCLLIVNYMKLMNNNKNMDLSGLPGFQMPNLATLMYYQNMSNYNYLAHTQKSQNDSYKLSQMTNFGKPQNDFYKYFTNSLNYTNPFIANNTNNSTDFNSLYENNTKLLNKGFINEANQNIPRTSSTLDNIDYPPPFLIDGMISPNRVVDNNNTNSNVKSNNKFSPSESMFSTPSSFTDSGIWEYKDGNSQSSNETDEYMKQSEIASYNYKRKLMDRYILEDDKTPVKRVKNSKSTNRTNNQHLQEQHQEQDQRDDDNDDIDNKKKKCRKSLNLVDLLDSNSSFHILKNMLQNPM